MREGVPPIKRSAQAFPFPMMIDGVDIVVPPPPVGIHVAGSAPRLPQL